MNRVSHSTAGDDADPKRAALPEQEVTNKESSRNPSSFRVDFLKIRLPSQPIRATELLLQGSRGARRSRQSLAGLSRPSRRDDACPCGDAARSRRDPPCYSCGSETRASSFAADGSAEMSFSCSNLFHCCTAFQSRLQEPRRKPFNSQTSYGTSVLPECQPREKLSPRWCVIHFSCRSRSLVLMFAARPVQKTANCISSGVV